MTLTTLPTRSEDSIGAEKSNAYVLKVAGTKGLTAAQYNTLADAVVDACASIGTQQLVSASATIAPGLVFVSGLAADATLTLTSPATGKAQAIVLAVESTSYAISLSGATANINGHGDGVAFALPDVSQPNVTVYLAVGYTLGDSEIWYVSALFGEYSALGVQQANCVNATKTADYALGNRERWAKFNTTSGALTATAPADPVRGQEFTLTKTNAGTNTLSVTGSLFNGSAGPVVCPDSGSAAVGSWTYRFEGEAEGWWMVAKA